jgi:hypothetical protein
VDDLLIFGGFGLLLVLIVIGFIWYIRRFNDRLATLWPPLAAVVGGAAKSTTLAGTYQGYPVKARMASESDDSSTDYFWEVTQTVDPRGRDWSASYTGDKLLGRGEQAWRLKTKDDALARRLADAGLLRHLEAWPTRPAISFKARNGALLYRERAKGIYNLPDSETFTRQLELLIAIARVNQEHNTAS